MRKINLVEHDLSWSGRYEIEISILKKLLANNLISAFHIGSTAINGIKAKPVIDILLEVHSLIGIDLQEKSFNHLGYIAKGEYGIKQRRFLYKAETLTTFHLHIYQSGHSEIERHRLFVEYLNSNTHRAIDYEKLKVGLQSKYKNNPDEYQNGKSLFISHIDRESILWKKYQNKCSTVNLY